MQGVEGGNHRLLRIEETLLTEEKEHFGPTYSKDCPTDNRSPSGEAGRELSPLLDWLDR